MSDNPDWEYLYRMDERRIAALEAALTNANQRKANTEWNAMVRQSDENLARAERAEAALAEKDKELLRSDKALEDAAGALDVCDVTLAEFAEFKFRHTAAGCGMDATTGMLHVMTTGVQG